jgi:hypothetical protein
LCNNFPVGHTGADESFRAAKTSGARRHRLGFFLCNSLYAFSRHFGRGNYGPRPCAFSSSPEASATTHLRRNTKNDIDLAEPFVLSSRAKGNRGWAAEKLFTGPRLLNPPGIFYLLPASEDAFFEEECPMSHFSRRTLSPVLFAMLVCALALVSFNVRAQTRPAGDKDKVEEPPFHEYKGVSIGMTADEARKKLGSPTDKGDKQDFYAFNDNESCQVYYDETKKVFAVSVTYLGGDIPVPKAVLGTEADQKTDGSLYKLVRFPKAGYWVSYTRTSGDSPMTIIAMQKIQ